MTCLFASAAITCRALAPSWRQLHSLHITFTALPPDAELTLSALSELRALEHLSLYASPDAAMDAAEHDKVRSASGLCVCVGGGDESGEGQHC